METFCKNSKLLQKLYTKQNIQKNTENSTTAVSVLDQASSEDSTGLEEPSCLEQTSDNALDLNTVEEEKELLTGLEYQRMVIQDAHRPLEERLEAYEDVIDSQVGETTLSRARNIERQTGVHQVYLKFEGGNPSGTQKDRVAFAQVMDAMRRGYNAITVATCGNYGAALSMAASLSNLKCIIYIPEAYHTKRIQEMEQCGAQVIRIPGDYENAVKVSQEHAQVDDIYDANPGGVNALLQFKAYSGIAYEIYDELREAPDVVAVPVSNGTTLVGVYRGFLSLYRRGKISRMPRMVAGSSYQKNPIIQAFLKKTPHCEDLEPDQIHETPVNEPLVNWHSTDGELALNAIRSTKGWASYASDKEMLTYSRLLRDKEGLNVLPASTAGLIALLGHPQEPLKPGRYVIVLTGRKP